MEDEHAHIMKETNYHEFQKQKEIEFEAPNKEEEELEALSLCDMPLNSRSASKCSSMDDASFSKILRSHSPKSSFVSDTTESFFEFFSGFSSSSDMCPADDIIFCGKLVPFKDQNDNHRSMLSVVEAKKPPLQRRRSESLSSVTRSNSVSIRSSRLLMRNSRSLDYRRLHDSSPPSSSAASPVPEVDRNFSARGISAADAAAKKAMKPRWYSLVFGTMRAPPEMDLSDMKNRQIRRNSSTTMFPAAEPGGANRCSGKVSWRILKALSCKDHSSVAIRTSFALPQASQNFEVT